MAKILELLSNDAKLLPEEIAKLTGKNVDFIERDFIVHAQVAVRFLPIQADFSGVSNPVDLYIGRIPPQYSAVVTAATPESPRMVCLTGWFM